MLPSKPLRLAKRLVASVPGARWLKRRLFGEGITFPVMRPIERGKVIQRTDDELVNKYATNETAHEADTFVLYRIIGNDLVPRHKKGQSRENLAFILEHEPELEGCEKRFVVNRIIDPDEERAVIDMLEAAGVGYLHLPFSMDTYRQLGWDIEGVPPCYRPHSSAFFQLQEDVRERIEQRLYQHKNRYVMNNNGARNAALEEGRGLAKWVLPWDGNCFVTADAWQAISKAVTAAPFRPYFITPMARITDNQSLLDPDARFEAKEEPQIIFRRDAEERFDERYVYGRRPKVELLWRLGVSGIWDDWPIEPWDLACPDFASQAGEWQRAGWVARLFSGQAHLEADRAGLIGRGRARNTATTTVLRELDDRFTPHRLPPAPPLELDALQPALKEAAEAAMQRGPYSVVDKKTLPPSNNLHDYWHPAPYYWPTLPGLPYMPRDGQRVPGTRLYEPASDKYDRTRLQRLFDDTYVLALSGSLTSDATGDGHAARLIRHWFIDPDTAMNPHMRFAQVRQGWQGNEGSSSGIIEAKDFYFFLDAVSWLEQRQALDADIQDGFRQWLATYLDWLIESPQGQRERRARNNHGTYYDLQVVAIAGFLGDSHRVRHALRDSRARLMEQFTPDGQQPEEMRRTTTAHYCCFNLQGWVHLAELASRHGVDLWGQSGPQGEVLKVALEWLLAHQGKPWPYQQIDTFDEARFLPLRYAYRLNYLKEDEHVLAVAYVDENPLFHPHDGVRPFWQLRPGPAGGSLVAA